MIFNLVDGWGDSSLGKQFFEVLYTVIRNSDSLGLAGLGDFLEFLPCLGVGPFCLKIAGAIGMFGEQFVVS